MERNSSCIPFHTSWWDYYHYYFCSYVQRMRPKVHPTQTLGCMLLPYSEYVEDVHLQFLGLGCCSVWAPASQAQSSALYELPYKDIWAQLHSVHSFKLFL